MASWDYRVIIHDDKEDGGILVTHTSVMRYIDAYRRWVILTKDEKTSSHRPTIQRRIGGTWVEVDPATGEVQATQ